MAKVIITLKGGRKIEFDPEFYNELKIVGRLKAEGKEIKSTKYIK